MDVRKKLATGIGLDTVSIIVHLPIDGEEYRGTITLKGIGLTFVKAMKIIRESYDKATVHPNSIKGLVYEIRQGVGYESFLGTVSSWNDIR